MAGLEDMLRSSAPGGNIGKPLMLALLALLASGALFGGGSSGRSTSTSAGSQPTSDDGAGRRPAWRIGRTFGQASKGWVGRYDQFLGWFRSKQASIAWSTGAGTWA